MKLGERFDAWVVSGPFTAADLGRYRIVYAASALLLLPRPEALSELPSFFWKPPLGPFELIDHPPAHEVLLAVTTVEIAALALLLVGLFTKAASIVAGLTFILADGLSHSYGAIHHYVLLAVVPLVLCWTDWGRRFSLDARRKPIAPNQATPQWPMRLFALLIAVAFATAGIAKVRSGWLDTASQSTRAHFVNGYLFGGQDKFLAPIIARIGNTSWWEFLDWATVILELGLLVTVLSWTWFRRSLALVIVFHLGVLMMFNIAFAANIVAYAAFVQWSLWWPERSDRTLPVARIIVNGVVVGIVAWLIAAAITPTAEFYVKSGFVLAGAGLAFALVATPRSSTTSSG